MDQRQRPIQRRRSRLRPPPFCAWEGLRRSLRGCHELLPRGKLRVHEAQPPARCTPARSVGMDCFSRCHCSALRTAPGRPFFLAFSKHCVCFASGVPSLHFSSRHVTSWHRWHRRRDTAGFSLHHSHTLGAWSFRSGFLLRLGASSPGMRHLSGTGTYGSASSGTGTYGSASGLSALDGAPPSPGGGCDVVPRC